MSGERDGGEDRSRPSDGRPEGKQGQPQGGRQGQHQGGQQGQGRGRGQPRQGQGRGQQGRGRGQPGRTRGRGRQARSGGIDFGSLPWVSGAIQGASYYVVALIVVALIVFVDFMVIASGSGGSMGGVGGSGKAVLYALGWVFYGAHFVSVSAGALGSGNLVNFLGSVGLPSLVYYLVPPIFLFLAGRSIARSTGHAGMPSEQLAARGVTAVAGYLPAAVLGSVVFTLNGVGPDLTTSVLVMGLGYPVVFGGLGGYLAKR